MLALRSRHALITTPLTFANQPAAILHVAAPFCLRALFHMKIRHVSSCSDIEALVERHELLMPCRSTDGYSSSICFFLLSSCFYFTRGP